MSLANILSSRHVMSIPGRSVDMDIILEPTFVVSPKGRSVCFTRVCEGLFHCKTQDLENLAHPKVAAEAPLTTRA